MRSDGDRPEDTADPWPAPEFFDKKTLCIYNCVVLPDTTTTSCTSTSSRLNAPTGAWCSLTSCTEALLKMVSLSQCTYRCVVLPDRPQPKRRATVLRSQCTYRCVVLPDLDSPKG